MVDHAVVCAADAVATEDEVVSTAANEAVHFLLLMETGSKLYISHHPIGYNNQWDGQGSYGGYGGGYGGYGAGGYGDYYAGGYYNGYDYGYGKYNKQQSSAQNNYYNNNTSSNYHQNKNNSNNYQQF